MTITITKEVKQPMDLHVPSFFRNKNESHYVGLLDEVTVVEIYIYKDSVSIQNRHVDAIFAKSTLEAAAANYHGCSENEFMEAFHKAWNQMRLKPELEVIDVLGSLSEICNNRKENA